MTAMSARSAPELPAPAELASASRHVRVPGTARTYEVRDQLRGLGLRWDPATHAWHGTIRPGRRSSSSASCGSAPRSSTRSRRSRPRRAWRPQRVRSHQNRGRARPESPGGPPGTVPRPAPRPEPPTTTWTKEGDERPCSTPRFTVWEVTSGLPDDSREADERSAERRLRDLRGRVKAARAALSANPGRQEALRDDWRREAAFYARFGITQAQFRDGAASEAVEAAHDGFEGVNSAIGLLSVAVGRKAALLSGPRWRAEGNRIPNTL